MSTNEGDRRAVPPYVSYSTFQLFLERLTNGVPGRVDSSLLKTFSGTAQNQLISALKYMGLADTNGNTTKRLESLATSMGREREQVFREIIIELP